MNEIDCTGWVGLDLDDKNTWTGTIRVMWPGLHITAEQARDICAKSSLTAVHEAARALADQLGVILSIVPPGGNHADPKAELMILVFRPKPEPH